MSPYGGIAESYIDINSSCAREVIINHLQKELGFDDDVAEYVLQNAPDGADVTDLMALAIEYFGGKATYNPNVTATLEFNSIEEYGVFIQAVFNNTSYPVAYTMNNDNYIAAIQYPLSGDLGMLTWGVEMILDVDLKTNLSDYKINSVTTNTYGVVNPWNWEEVGVQITQSNDDPNIQEIKVLGTQYIGIKLKSLSFSIDFDWSLYCDQNKTSGEIVQSFHRPWH